MKEIKIAFASKKVKKLFEELKEGKFEDKKIYGFIQRAKKDLKINPTCGTKIPHNLVPEYYAQKYNINNLWKYNLPNAWRLIYTMKATQVIVLAIILE